MGSGTLLYFIKPPSVPEESRAALSGHESMIDLHFCIHEADG